MGFNVGAKVLINKCDVCPSIVGKTAKITGFTMGTDCKVAELNFGRGRPQANRPNTVNVDDLSLVKEEK